MYTPTRIAGREAVVEFLRQKLGDYQIIYKDISALTYYLLLLIIRLSVYLCRATAGVHWCVTTAASGSR